MYILLFQTRNILSTGIKHFYRSSYRSFCGKIESTATPKNIIFFGTDEFSLISLQSLLARKQEGYINKLTVVTVPLKKPFPAIPKYCLENGVPFHEWPPNFPLQGYDVGIVVSFRYLIPQNIIESFPLGILNVHGSLLPRWRGPSPIAHAILNGDPVTGVTIMKIHPHRFDEGEIICKREIRIEEDTKSSSLTKEMAHLGADCLIHCLSNLDALLPLAQPQPTSGITKAPKLKEKDGRIFWHHTPVRLIRSMHAALDDLFPVWTTWQGEKLRLLDVSIRETETLHALFQEGMTAHDALKNIQSAPRPSEEEMETSLAALEQASAQGPLRYPGQIRFDRREKILVTRAADGIVAVRAVALKGRKTMTAAEFNNGFLSKVKYSKRYFY